MPKLGERWLVLLPGPALFVVLKTNPSAGGRPEAGHMWRAEETARAVAFRIWLCRQVHGTYYLFGVIHGG